MKRAFGYVLIVVGVGLLIAGAFVFAAWGIPSRHRPERYNEYTDKHYSDTETLYSATDAARWEAAWAMSVAAVALALIGIITMFLGQAYVELAQLEKRFRALPPPAVEDRLSG